MMSVMKMMQLKKRSGSWVENIISITKITNRSKISRTSQPTFTISGKMYLCENEFHSAEGSLHIFMQCPPLILVCTSLGTTTASYNILRLSSSIISVIR